jgi:hypothetical protein
MVILQTDNVALRQLLLVDLKQSIIIFLRQRIGAFIVHTQKLLTMAMLCQPDNPLFGDSGTPIDFDNTVCLSAHVFQDVGQCYGIGIIADGTDTKALSAKGGHISRHRRCAAAGIFPANNLQHLYRCFRADPKSIAIDIAVQHKIADQQYLRRSQMRNRF